LVRALDVELEPHWLPLEFPGDEIRGRGPITTHRLRGMNSLRRVDPNEPHINGSTSERNLDRVPVYHSADGDQGAPSLAGIAFW
jgi:hypothetical protein